MPNKKRRVITRTADDERMLASLVRGIQGCVTNGQTSRKQATTFALIQPTQEELEARGVTAGHVREFLSQIRKLNLVPRVKAHRHKFESASRELLKELGNVTAASGHRGGAPGKKRTGCKVDRRPQAGPVVLAAHRA